MQLPSSRTVWLLVASAVGALGGAWLLVSHVSSPSQDGRSSSGASDASTRSRQERSPGVSAAELAALIAERSAEAPLTEDPAADDHLSKHEESTASPPKEDTRTVEAWAVGLENQFQSAPPPTTASRELEGQISQAFTQLNVDGASLTSVHCKATLCRVDLVFDDAEADLELNRSLFMEGKGIGGRAFSIPSRVRHSDNTIHVSAYVFDEPPPTDAEAKGAETEDPETEDPEAEQG